MQRVVGLILGITALASTLGAYADGIAEARAAWKAYEEAAQSLNALKAANNQTGIDEKEKEIRTHLLDAQRGYKSAGVTGQGEPDLVMELVSVHEALGNFDLSAELLEGIHTQQPDNTAVLHRLAENFLKMGASGEKRAHETLLAAQNLEGDTPSATTFLLQGDLFWKRKLYDLATTQYTKAAEADKNLVRAQIGHALALVQAGEIIAASNLLDSLGTAAAPHDIETRVKLRQVLHTYAKFQGNAEETVEFHRNYSRLMYRAGRIPDAILVIRRAIVMDPDDENLHNFLAQMMMQLGNKDGVIQALQASLVANPNQPQVTEQLTALGAPTTAPKTFAIPPTLARPPEE